MRELLLLRHAKSDWSNGGLSDHDRPLNDRGRRAAPAIGRWIAEHDLRPAFILCSTAARTRETLALAEDAGAFADVPRRFDESLYLPTVDCIFRALGDAPADAERLLLVTHNPTCEELLERLDLGLHAMPTASLARIAFDVDAWSNASDADARLLHLQLVRALTD